MAKPVEQQDSAGQTRAVNWSALAPGIAFVVIIVAAFLVYSSQQGAARKAAEAQQAEVQQLGLPDEFPLDDIAPYPGLLVTDKKRDATESDQGEPMDLWEVKGTTSDDRKKVFEFFKEKLLARDMSQTRYISIPTGYGVTYADALYLVELEIEDSRKDKNTNLVMRVYRVRK